MAKKVRVFVDHINDGYLSKIQKGLYFIEMTKKIRTGDTVFIKPNLTFPYYKKGVMTSPECIEQLIISLKDYSVKVIIGEADGGGYNRFLMDDVFEKTGIRLIAEKHNVKLVNLSTVPSRNIYFEQKGKQFDIPIPKFLLDEVDLFITIAVPKVHSNTGVSLSIKNQWGCIQEPSSRLKLHPYFPKVVYEINKILNSRVAIIDGMYGLNRNGPMRGDVEELNWLMVSDNLLAADLTCCALMRINPKSISYLNIYNTKEQLPPIESFYFNKDYTKFFGPKFYLRKELLDYPGFFAFRSPFLAHLAYHSVLSKLLHKILYLFREKFYDHD